VARSGTAKAWNNKGYYLDKLGKYQEAEKYYDRAKQIRENGVKYTSDRKMSLS
jgi:tetratricopeptide (TPR) repeat protein